MVPRPSLAPTLHCAAQEALKGLYKDAYLELGILLGHRKAYQIAGPHNSLTTALATALTLQLSTTALYHCFRHSSHITALTPQLSQYLSCPAACSTRFGQIVHRSICSILHASRFYSKQSSLVCPRALKLVETVDTAAPVPQQ